MRGIAYIFLIGCLVVLSGCSNSKRITEGKPLRPREPNYILKQSYKRSLDWDWLGFKMSADVKANGASEDFTLSVRMARDSAIWVSLSPALGVEVARILLTPDSVHLISKVPMNKFVYSGDYQQVQDFLEVPFDFYSFQDLFTGSPLGLDPWHDKFASKVDDNNYLIVEKFPRKVKKLLGGLDEKALAELGPDSLSINLNDRHVKRILERTPTEELLIKRYWFDGIEFSPNVDLFNDLKTGLTIKIERHGNEGHEEGYLPSQTILRAFGDGVQLEAILDIRRSRVNRKYPPADYERRHSL